MLLFLPSAALTLIQTAAATPLPQGSGSTAGQDGALGKPRTKPELPVRGQERDLA